MLEVLYDKTTKEVRGWCADPTQFGNFKPKEGQRVVVLPVDPPNYHSKQFLVDLAKKKITGEPAPTRPVVSMKKEIDDLKTRVKLLEEKSVPEETL